jgi:hypothetical protein
MWKELFKAIGPLLDKWMLLIALGVVVVILGLSGRVTYVPIVGIWQYVDVAFGAVLVLIGLVGLLWIKDEVKAVWDRNQASFK